MKAFILALQFLSVITLMPNLMAGAGDLARARAWYGAVGLILGLILAGLAYLLDMFLPPLALAALLVAFWAGLSRCLHLDGLADTADALVHTTTRERALEIMKDTHLGSFGLAAVVCLLLVKFGALASLGTGLLFKALIIAPPLGRAMAAAMSVILPPATPGKGLGAAASSGDGLLCLLASVISAVFIAALAGGLAGLWASLGALICAALLGIWFQRRLGGVTGDNLGATIELSEAAALLVFCAAL
jgi:adenosylcobinamide-GDP ribazoletransferase